MWKKDTLSSAPVAAGAVQPAPLAGRAPHVAENCPFETSGPFSLGPAQLAVMGPPSLGGEMNAKRIP